MEPTRTSLEFRQSVSSFEESGLLALVGPFTGMYLDRISLNYMYAAFALHCLKYEFFSSAV